MELKVIPLSSIIVEDRFREDYGDMDSLVLSIREEGIIQPLAVCARPNNQYRLLAGGRRLRACDLAGIIDVPVRIYPETLSELEMRSIELMENLIRKDMSWVEMARLRKEIKVLQEKIHGRKVSTAPDAEGVSMRDVADMIGVSRTTMSQDEKLLAAIEAMPIIKDAKNRTDALKMVNRLEEEMVLAEIQKRITERNASTPVEVVNRKLIDNYILSDFFSGINSVPERSIDIIEIDPPYGIALGTSNIKKTTDSLQTNTKNYNEIPAHEYGIFLDNLFRNCFRVMSDNSWLLCWYAQEPWSEIVYQAACRVGLKGTRIALIWNKEGSTGQCNQPDMYLANLYESCFYFRKGNPAITRRGRSNVFSFKPVSSLSKIHPTERPIELMQDILRTFSWEGARLMVPFLGSGNTLLAGANIGMTGFGYDLSQEYKNAYSVRVIGSRPGEYRSYKKEE